MSINPPAALFAAVQSDAPGALDQLIRAWLPVVVAWAGRLGGPRVNREDIAHDVFLVVLRSHPKVESPEKFPAWLYSVTRNITSRHQRRAWLRRWVPGLEIEPVDPRSTRRPEYSDTARWVWEVLEALPDAQREVVVLCDLEGRTREEVAELLGVSPGTIKGRLRLGREKFRRVAHSRGYAADTAGVGG